MASTADPSGAAGAEPARGLSLQVVIPALDEERTGGSVSRGIPRARPRGARASTSGGGTLGETHSHRVDPA